MKKWADQKRKPDKFQVGDMVLVRLKPEQLKLFRRIHKGLVRKNEGPFRLGLTRVAKVLLPKKNGWIR